jgi:hypothetical protein
MSNKYVSFYDNTNEMNLLQKLCQEVVNLHGFELRYISRNNGENLDIFLGEAELSHYQNSISVMAQCTDLEDFQGWQGKNDFINQFGLQMNDKIHFAISTKEWKDKIIESANIHSTLSGKVSVTKRKNTVIGTGTKFTSELNSNSIISINNVNYHVNVISSNTQLTVYPTPNTSVSNVNISNTITYIPPRPMEEDIFYFPIMGKFFSITFVEHEQIFYPLGTLLTYDCTCELYTYSSERIDTGNTVIDNLLEPFSFDILLEPNTANFDLKDHTALAENDDIQQSANAVIIQQSDPRFVGNV